MSEPRRSSPVTGSRSSNAWRATMMRFCVICTNDTRRRHNASSSFCAYRPAQLRPSETRSILQFAAASRLRYRQPTPSLLRRNVASRCGSYNMLFSPRLDTLFSAELQKYLASLYL